MTIREDRERLEQQDRDNAAANTLRDALVWYDAHEAQIGHLPQWVDQARKVVQK